MKLAAIVIVLVVALLGAGAYLYLMTRKGAQPAPGPEQDPSASLYKDVREMFLTIEPRQLKIAKSDAFPNVWAVMMETAYPEGTSMLLSFVNGETSLYLSNGGGTIGAGSKPNVEIASKMFVKEAAKYLKYVKPADSFLLPSDGKVRFYLRTFSGVLTAEAEEQVLGDGKHALSPLYIEGLAVLGQVQSLDAR